MSRFLFFSIRHGVLVAFLCLGVISAKGQFWSETFGLDGSGTCASQGTSADGYGTINGIWTETLEGVNGPLNNRWYISTAEIGSTTPPACGSRCATNPGADNQTLHIGQFNPVIDVGATYSGYANPGNIYNTNVRIESPTIDCSDKWDIDMTFWYSASSMPNDRGYIVYSPDDGGAWIDLLVLPSTGALCAPESINWESYSVTLPSSANNNTDVKIGFRWENNSDGVFNDVSIAVDSINLYTGPAPVIPVADFEVLNDDVNFCENNCISFTDLTEFDPDFSDGASGSTYTWTFEGGTPATSNLQNPVVCFNDPGIYDITLTVEDNIGPSAPVTMTDMITVQDCGPVIIIDSSTNVVCSTEECIDFTDLSTGNDVNAWLWTFTSANGVDIQTSNLQNPTGICLDEVGFYDVTLSATDLDGTEEQTFPNYIEVLDCSGPDIDFSANRLVICPGDCIQFTDESTSIGTILSWEWTLPGGQADGEVLPETSTQQNPLVCYDSPGVYNVTLSAVDFEGVSAITKTISITVDPCTGPPDVNIGASETVICRGDCVDFYDQSLGLVEDWLWIFQGIEDIDDVTSDEKYPSVICYQDTGKFNVTLTVSNSNNELDTQTFVDFITVENCINPPVPRIEVSTDTICAGDCVDFFDMSTGINIDSWEWNFQGAADGSTTSSFQDPTGICYNSTGTFSVSLMTSGAGGDSTIVYENAITVVSTPECRPQIEPMIPDTICAGDCAFFSANITNADSVLWTFQNGTPDTSRAISPGLVCYDEIGEFIVIIEAWNAAGASQPIVTNVVVGERPPLDAGPDRVINAGAVIQITANVGDEIPSGSFLWQPYDYVDDFNAQTVTTSPNESIDYIVYYSEEGSCTAIDTVKVQVNFQEAIGVPSAFSPNGDGFNDELKVLGQGIAQMDFKIFNRYGQLVFKTNDQSVGWDGRKNGTELNPGTFVYTLEVAFAEGRREVFTGNVTLVR